MLFKLMIKKLFVLVFVLSCSLSYAQTIKTDVLVIGGGPGGVAAAIQCAHSRVKTELAVQNDNIINKAALIALEENRHIISGIWDEFPSQPHNNIELPDNDTTQKVALQVQSKTGDTGRKKKPDTTKYLTAFLNTTFKTIKKDGDRWEVTITQNKKTITFKTRVIVDATPNGDVALNAGAKFTDGFDNFSETDLPNAYRTSIASGEALPGHYFDDAHTSKTVYPPYPVYCVPIRAVLLKNTDNILITEKAIRGEKNQQYEPLQMAVGQGVGTVAAYCAFFKTTTQNLRVRTIQGELLDFKGSLLPFADITTKDPDWRAIQQVGATGMLKGVQNIKGNTAQFLFNPDSLVNTSEIKPVLTEIYTRAFLWFNKEKPGEKFMLGNLLSFISDYTLTEPQTLKTSVQKAWKTQYKFQRDFDLNRQVTRREFAVLANKFLNPFDRTVDLDGRLVN
jgi:hypothetical protein